MTDKYRFAIDIKVFKSNWSKRPWSSSRIFQKFLDFLRIFLKTFQIFRNSFDFNLESLEIFWIFWNLSNFFLPFMIFHIVALRIKNVLFGNSVFCFLPLFEKWFNSLLQVTTVLLISNFTVNEKSWIVSKPIYVSM